jgi:hypothetical protein
MLHESAIRNLLCHSPPPAPAPDVTAPLEVLAEGSSEDEEGDGGEGEASQGKEGGEGGGAGVPARSPHAEAAQRAPASGPEDVTGAVGRFRLGPQNRSGSWCYLRMSDR